MKQPAKTAIVLGGTAIALVVGGGISAWADWDAGAKAATVRTTVSRVPAVEKPKVERSRNSSKVSWDPPEATPDRPFDGYIVVRRIGSLSQTVCAVAARSHACSDQEAPTGVKVTYVVRAIMGATWFGPDSDPSEPLLVPAGPKPKLSTEVSDVAEAARTVATPPSEKSTRSAEPTAAPTPDNRPTTPSSSPTPTETFTTEDSVPEQPVSTESTGPDLTER